MPAATTRIHGYLGQVLADTDGTSPATLVALSSINAWTLNASKDKVDVTAFGDTNKVKVVGLPDYTGTLGGWWDENDDTLFDIIFGSTGAILRLLPRRTTTTQGFQGPAFLDGSINCPSNGGVSVSATFDASGNWERLPLTHI